MQKNTCFLTEQEARKARKLSGGESVGEQWMEGWREEVGAVRVTSTLCPLDAPSLFSFSYIFFAASLNFSAFKSHQIGFLVLASFQQSHLVLSCFGFRGARCAATTKVCLLHPGYQCQTNNRRKNLHFSLPLLSSYLFSLTFLL